jgi:hypothetical protein
MATAVEPPHDPTKEARRREARGWLLGALGVLIFAFSIPMTRLASGPATDAQLPAAFVAIGRAAVAGLLALGWLAWRRSPLPARQHWPALAITAAGVVFGWPLCLGYAVLHVDAIHASVVTGVLPIATAGVAALLLRQRASAAFWACFAWYRGLALGGALRVSQVQLRMNPSIIREILKVTERPACCRWPAACRRRTFPVEAMREACAKRAGATTAREACSTPPARATARCASGWPRSCAAGHGGAGRHRC